LTPERHCFGASIKEREMSQPWADRPGEAYSPGPQQYPSVPPAGAVQPYPAQPYPAQPYSGQPYSSAPGQLVSLGGRFGAFLLDGVLVMVTLGIGYLIWALITWSDGQTPGKKLLGHVVVDANTGAPLDWGRMALRQFVIQGLIGSVSFGIFFWIDSLMIFGDGQRTLHDRMANSVVRHV
jgi:uncharacterized RDD family membrane protein YckC